MKVLLINGSARKQGCTFTALSEVAGELEKNGVETEIYHIGTGPVRGCIACYKCMKIGKCALEDDICNEMLEKAMAADGIVIGSPVYFAGPNGALCALLDRMFFCGGDSYLKYKPAAAVVSCRRGGAETAFDKLNKYFTYSQMPIVTARYWNSVHGRLPEEVLQDLEGLQTMRIIGKNMAWLLKSIAAGNQPIPEQEERIRTSFVR